MQKIAGHKTTDRVKRPQAIERLIDGIKMATNQYYQNKALIKLTQDMPVVLRDIETLYRYLMYLYIWNCFIGIISFALFTIIIFNIK